METVDDDLGPWHLLFNRAHEAFVHIRAGALDRVPKRLGYRAQKGRHRLLLAVCQHRQDLDASPRERHGHQHDDIAVPTLARNLVDADHPQPLPSVQSTARSIQRSRMPSIVSSEPPSLRAVSATVELINMRKAHGSYAFVLGLRGSYHSHRCVVVGVARAVRASIPLGPNLDADGHVEPGQMAKTHDRIQPMQVAKLPTAATAPCPFSGCSRRG